MRSSYLVFTLLISMLLSSCLELPEVSPSESLTTQTDTQESTDIDSQDQLVQTQIDSVITDTSTDTQIDSASIIPEFYIESTSFVYGELDFYGSLSIAEEIVIPTFNQTENFENPNLLEQDSNHYYSYTISRGELSDEVLAIYPELTDETFDFEWSFEGEIISQSRIIENPAPSNNKTIVEYTITDQFGQILTGTHTFYNHYNKLFGLDLSLKKDFMFIETVANVDDINLEDNLDNYTFTWQTGDGFTYETAIFEHTYAEKGTYHLSLTATDLSSNEIITLEFELDYSVKTAFEIQPDVTTNDLNITLNINATGFIDNNAIQMNAFETAPVDLTTDFTIDLNTLSSYYNPAIVYSSCIETSTITCDEILFSEPYDRFEYSINYGDDSQTITGETNKLQFEHSYSTYDIYTISVSIYDRTSKHSAEAEYTLDLSE